MRTKLTQVAGLVSAIVAGAIIGYGHTSEAATETVYEGVAPAIMPTIEPIPASHLPILLVVDADVDAGWNIAQAAQDWNDATGCDLFTLDDDGQAHDTIRIHQEADLMYEGAFEVGGLYASDTGDIYLNTEWVDFQGAAAHEIGHVLGLDHHDSRLGVMSGHFDADRSGPSSSEVDQARQLHPTRCN